MPRDQLILSAQEIEQPSEQTAAALDRIAEICAAALTAYMLEQKNWAELIGPGNLEVMEANHLAHFRYMASIAHLFDATSFVETVLWVFRTYRARGFQVAYWQNMLPKSKRILKQLCEPAVYDQIRPIYDWLITHIPSFKELSESDTSFYETLGIKGGRHGS